ncbi:MAG: ATP-binding cassette domain-containing protein [Bacteroidales bacterium]|nr:ATP-binding cassette domain-containing protein [Bacteroidales bacterium]
MSESILKALMKLFAIIANVNKDGVSETSRSIVESYLTQHLSHDQVVEYINLFDEFLAFHHRNITKKDGTQVRKRTSSNSVKVLMICQQINEELQQEQKVLVILQLLEFISYGDEITEQELDFVNTVADTFKIPQSDYLNCKAFILSKIDDIPQKEQILVIDNNSDFDGSEIKHIENKNLSGKIFMLQIISTNMYVFRYVGENDLYLNGHAILLNRAYLLNKGASIRSSRIATIYYSDIVAKYLHSKAKTKVVFTAKDVEFRFKNSENGIHKFNFSETGGQLIGIMGGSGVGKSTLLNVLNGNLEPQSGEILINGYNINNNHNELEGVIGFVPQDDLLIEELTVYQNLYYNAKLCFDNFSEDEINKAITKVLEDLELYEIKDLTVGDVMNKFISGGQRKRLNIALELIREPSVLFVDEPTSGLSSMDSEMVMDLLKEQTLKGKLVIINIHQPSSDIYKMFDKLLILDRGGYLIYYGNPIDAVVYFKTMSNHVNALESECTTCGNVNPEKVLQIIEAKVVDEYGRLAKQRKVSSKEWYELYAKNIETKNEVKEAEEELPENYFKLPNRFKQFKIFSIRNVLSKLTDKQYMLINFLESPLLAALLAFFIKYLSGNAEDPDAYVFSENLNVPIYLFMAVVVALFIGLTVSAEEIIRDRQILKRESFLHLSKFSYINSKVVVLFIISAIQTLTFVLIGNLILEIQGMTLIYWLLLFTTSCFANMLGLIISASLDSVVTIYILIPFIVVPQLLFSGTMVKFEKLHKSITSYKYVPFVGDVMTSRWAYEALAVYQFKNNKFQKEFFNVEKEMSAAAFRNNFLIPKLQSKLESCLNNITDKENENENKIRQDLKILKNEILILGKTSQKNRFNLVDSLEYSFFNRNIALETRKYLKKIKKEYNKKYNIASRAKDKKFNALIDRMSSKENVNKLKNDYHNDNLASMVLNKQELHKIYETEDRMLQLMEPIFKDPESNIGRAHFYAPVKILFGKSFDTYWFNLVVIWITSLILYITLLGNGLRKTINFLGNIKFKKSR